MRIGILILSKLFFIAWLCHGRNCGMKPCHVLHVSSAYLGFNWMPVHIMEQGEVDINRLITDTYIMT